MFHSLDCINWHEQNNEMLGVTLLFNNKHLIQRQGVGRGGGGVGGDGTNTPSCRCMFQSSWLRIRMRLKCRSYILPYLNYDCMFICFTVVFSGVS